MVIKRVSYLTYKIQKDQNSRIITVYVDHFKTFLAPSTQKLASDLPKETETAKITSPPNTSVQIQTRRGAQ